MRGDGRIFQRGGRWWIAYYGPDGTEIRESSKSDKESAARKLLNQRLREVSNHRQGIRSFEGPSAERLTISDLLDALEGSYKLRQIKSLRRTLLHIKPVRDYFGEMRALSVTSDHVDVYIAERQEKKRANATINRELELLGAAFSLAVKRKKISTKLHITRLEERNARSGFFEADEHRKMLEHLPPAMAAMADFAYQSGWRKEEIRKLRWDAVDRSAKEVRLRDSKSGDGRVLPLDDEGWQLFEQLWVRRQYTTRDGTTGLSEYVFHRGDGQPVSEWYFCELWETARNAAGLPQKLFHDYRRTAARNMIRAGVPQVVAMSITGHKTISMFQRYSITSPDDMREALRKQRQHLRTDTSSSNVAPFTQAPK